MATFNPFAFGTGGNSADDPFNTVFTCALGPRRCSVCRSTTNLRRCADCKVVSYCGAPHQSQHRAEHREVCRSIKKSRQKLEQAERDLRAKPADVLLPEDVFNTCVGRFWGILDTRDYMRARFAAADALLAANTRAAVELALNHFMDMLRLRRPDNLGIRDIVPSLMLRLGQEQECYDFLKWWATADRDGNYDWGDMTLPYLNIRNADAFEPIDPFIVEYALSLSHMVTLTLLKTRLFLDIEAYDNLEPNYGFGPPDTLQRAVGKLAKTKVQSLRSDPTAISMLAQTVHQQYKKLCAVVHKMNPHFWEALVDGESHKPPPSYSQGSPEEADLAVYHCKPAWGESDDAINMIEADTSKYASVYQSAPSSVSTSSARARVPQQGGPSYTGQVLDKRKGNGLVFPQAFRPSLSTTAPTELFPATSIGGHDGNQRRFVSRNDRSQVLVFVDGACPNNGQAEPRAGWAVVFGPLDTDILSGRLENEGPFGDSALQTSNRAELRATIAALRLIDWRADTNCSTLVVATDSTYVVDGATKWVQGWIGKGWKTANGADVKNRDLWEMLLGEVERCKGRGLTVQLWRIPREQNSVADKAAKHAANKLAVSSFQELGSSGAAQTQTTPARTGPVRVLEICFEYDRLYEDIWNGVVSGIRAKADVVERATTVEAVIAMLNQSTPPSIILVADGGITREKKVFERVVDRLREGSTVILAGCFSSFVNLGEFNRFFTRLGLPWRRGSYHRADVVLRSESGALVDIPGANRLSGSYSQKALFVSGIDKSTAWYTEAPSSREAAVAWTKVGSGHLGYVGDVNGERESCDVVLAMCGFLG